MWPEGFTPRKPPSVAGGLLLLADSTEKVASDQAAASVKAELWETGWPDTSMLALTVEFAKPMPGLRWYVVVSGQYKPDSETNINAFCTGPPGTRTGAVVRCPNYPSAGSVDIEYRFGDRIGLIYEGGIYRITDMRGYIDNDATIITGRVAPPEYGQFYPTSIDIPIPTPDRTRLGSDEYGSLALIGPRGGGGTGWDLNDSLGRLPAQYADTAAHLATVATKRPIRHIGMRPLQLRLYESLNTRNIEWASPPPDRSDQLTWDTREGNLGPISFLIHDPFEQNELVLRSFAAGVVVSIGVGVILFLIERRLV